MKLVKHTTRNKYELDVSCEGIVSIDKERELVLIPPGLDDEDVDAEIEPVPQKKKRQSATDRIIALLDQLKASTSASEFESPAKAPKLPTFDSEVSRKLSPMLKAWFAYAGSRKIGKFDFFNPAQMAAQMRQESTRATLHSFLRDDKWLSETTDKCWTLFGTFVGCHIYLGWEDNEDEPGVWLSIPGDTRACMNLESFMVFCFDSKEIEMSMLKSTGGANPKNAKKSATSPDTASIMEMVRRGKRPQG